MPIRFMTGFSLEKSNGIFTLSHSSQWAPGTWLTRKTESRRETRVRPTRTPDWGHVRRICYRVLSQSPARQCPCAPRCHVMTSVYLSVYLLTAYPDDVSVWFGRLSDIDRAAGTPSKSSPRHFPQLSPPRSQLLLFPHSFILLVICLPPLSRLSWNRFFSLH